MLSLALALPLASPPPVADVWLGERGPYRFMVDTGAETSVVDPSLAREAGLVARYRVEVGTVTGSRLVPGHPAVDLRFAPSSPFGPSELLWFPLDTIRQAVPDARGILGMSTLRGHDLLLDLRTGEALVDTAPGEPGEPIPFRWLGGRIAVEALVEAERRLLILDSGASHLMLYGTAGTHGPGGRVRLATNEGSREVPLVRVGRLAVGVLSWQGVPAAAVPRPADRPEDGLLPASLFDWVYIEGRGHRLLGRPRSPK